MTEAMNFKSAYTRIEPYVFMAVLLISVFPLFSTTYFPTLDGPAHLYNARLLGHYASNATISTFFSVNYTPSPNLFGHVSLYILDHVFSSAVSEKIIVLFYFLSFPLGFRYFMRSYSRENLFFSLIAIPLSHSCLMYMGFYNFSISFSFMFFALGLYHSRFYKTSSIRPVHYFLLFLLISLTYFSNVMCFLYLLAALFLYELKVISALYKSGQAKFISGRILKMALTALPAGICLLIFYSNIKFQPDTTSNNMPELWKFLSYFKSLVVYLVQTDALYLRVILGALLVLIVWIMVMYFRSAKPFFKTQFGNLIFLALTAIVFIAYFRIPNGSGAGMMTDRLCNLFFVSLALWIGSQEHIRLPKLLSLAIIIPHFYLLNIHRKEQQNYDRFAVNVTASAQFIEPNSTVLPVNFLHRWFFVTNHFPDYLGTQKPLIILDNYEAVMPWFLLNWDLQKMPYLTFNGKDTIANTWWPKGNKSISIKEIDYVYLLGDPNDLTEPQWQELKVNLDSAYTLCYINQKDLISIYKHR
jgi:hypothetical protein